MGKVVFEFDEEEDLSDINFIVNRKKVNAVLEELANYRRRIDKGYVDTLLVQGKTVVGKSGCTVNSNEALGAEYYIKDEDVYDELGKILDKAPDFLY